MQAAGETEIRTKGPCRHAKVFGLVLQALRSPEELVT